MSWLLCGTWGKVCSLVSVISSVCQSNQRNEANKIPAMWTTKNTYVITEKTISSTFLLPPECWTNCEEEQPWSECWSLVNDISCMPRNWDPLISHAPRFPVFPNGISRLTFIKDLNNGWYRHILHISYRISNPIHDVQYIIILVWCCWYYQ